MCVGERDRESETGREREWCLVEKKERKRSEKIILKNLIVHEPFNFFGGWGAFFVHERERERERERVRVRVRESEK